MIEIAEVYKGGTIVPELLYTYEVEVPDAESVFDVRAEIESLKTEIEKLKAK